MLRGGAGYRDRADWRGRGRGRYVRGMRLWLLIACVVLGGCGVSLANPPGSPPRPEVGTITCPGTSDMHTSAWGPWPCHHVTEAEYRASK